MRAAVFEGPGKPFAMKEVPLPVVKDHEVLVKVEACGICHTDYSVFSGDYQSRIAPPYIMGHEIIGTVAAVAEDSSDLSVGDRVLISPIESCGHCSFCRSGFDNLCQNRKVLGMDRNGGFAEYVCVPQKNLIAVDDTCSPAQWSLLVDAVSTAYHAICKQPPRPTDIVVVFGLGGLGFSAVLILKQLFQCRVIGVDVSRDKLNRAEVLGVETICSDASENASEQIRRMTGGMGADVVFEFVGRPETYHMAASCVRCGGRVVFVGAGDFYASIPACRFYRDQIHFTGSYSTTFSDLCRCVQAVRDGKLKLDEIEIVTLPALEINKGMQLFEDPKRTWNRVVTIWK